MKSWGQEKKQAERRKRIKIIWRPPTAKKSIRRTKTTTKQRSIHLLGQWTAFFFFPPVLLLISPFQFWDLSSLSLRQKAAVGLLSCVPHCGQSIKPKSLSSKAACSLPDRWRAVSLVSVGKQKEREWAIVERVSETTSWAKTLECKWLVSIYPALLISQATCLPCMCRFGCTCRVHYGSR